MPSAPYRVRFEYMNVPAYNKSWKMKHKKEAALTRQFRGWLMGLHNRLRNAQFKRHESPGDWTGPFTGQVTRLRFSQFKLQFKRRGDSIGCAIQRHGPIQ